MILHPEQLGFNPKFQSFYPYQLSAMMEMVESDKRFLVLKSPTGSGKTLMYLAYSRLMGLRTVIISPTKALGEQLKVEAGSNLSIIHGHSSYSCYRGGSDDYDGYCSRSDCQYQPAVIRSLSAQETFTTHAHWMHLANSRRPNLLGSFGILIIDEAHKVHDSICDSVEVVIKYNELRDYNLSSFPQSTDINEWIAFSNKSLPKLLESSLRMKLSRLARADSKSWVFFKSRYDSVVFRPIWPTDFSSSHLFRDVSKVVFVSATINEGHLSVLGLSPTDYDIINLPNPFPVENRPFIFYSARPGIRLTYRSTETQVQTLIRRADEIIERRLLLKGTFHSRSFAYNKKILDNSRFSDLMVSHNSSGLAGVVSHFHQLEAPAILTSPSIFEGFDFGSIEYQIILKVPYPNKKDSPVIAARISQNKDFMIWDMISQIMQAYGRGPRSVKQKTETWMLDYSWIDFYNKHRRKFDRYFRQAVRSSNNPYIGG